MGFTLIIGASSGIGEALARALAARGVPLVLTARREERLESLAIELRSQQGIGAIAIPADLADPAGPGQLLDAIQARGLEIDGLVNNAGIGLRGNFHTQSWERAEAMLQLMVNAPVQLTGALLPAMRTRGRGRIVNVASLAGLVPGLPGSTLYSASKAFLIRFSQSLAAENRAHGIQVMALCPGYVRSEFHTVLGVEERMRKLPGLFWMDADELAERTLAALDQQRVVVVPGRVNRLIAALAGLLPDGAAGALSAAFSRRYRRAP